jgi:hypothetical protein
MVVSPPEYLHEIQAALQRAENAYVAGDLVAAARHAEEGLATVRLTLTRLGPESVPPQYQAFFHALRIQRLFRQALALFKQGRLQLSRPPVENGSPSDVFLGAWQLLSPAIADLEEGLPVELLASEYPVAGRVLRSLARLRDRLRASLVESTGMEGYFPPLAQPALDPGRTQI